MNVLRETTVVRCPDGLPMATDLFIPAEGEGPFPVTVVCHGFKGFKDWGMFPPLAERLAGLGRAMVLFNFSHNGVGDEPAEFTRLDLFREQTISRHVEDLGAILDLVDEPDGQGWAGAGRLVRDRRTTVVGHSMGGAVALIRAAQDGRVAQVATLNGVSRLARISAEQAEELKNTGEVAITNARTGQVMPLGQAWFDDIEQHDLETSASEVYVPALVVQGEADENVLPEEGQTLSQWIAGARLTMVPDGGHTFGAQHPFAGWTPALEQACTLLDEFLPTVAP